VFGKRLVDANDKTLRPWRATVALAAVDAANADGWQLLDGPVHLACEFRFPRPKSHFGARGVLPSRAGRWHAQKPDVDKLLRAVCDALSDAGVWRDDAQVAVVSASKRWTETTPGLSVSVRAAVAS
jgi:crossover junction endodeoxyribonuclease RusA